MSKKKEWSRFVRDSNKRASIAFGIAVLSIGYNLLPIQQSITALWISGLIIMMLGCWVVINAIFTKSP